TVMDVSSPTTPNTFHSLLGTSSIPSSSSSSSLSSFTTASSGYASYSPVTSQYGQGGYGSNNNNSSSIYINNNTYYNDNMRNNTLLEIQTASLGKSSSPSSLSSSLPMLLSHDPIHLDRLLLHHLYIQSSEGKTLHINNYRPYTISQN